jgi:Uma2 family endonuclease
MTRGLGHESRKVTFSRAFELWAEFVGVRFEAFGSETARLQPEGKGLEPDECYFLGPRRPRRASGNALDLRTQPAPDLAIEIDVTSSSVPREPIYAAFKVREIWLWDGTKIVVRQLYRGRYRTIERSALLPDAPIHVFQLVMDRAIAAEDQQAGRDVLRAWLREHGR